MNKAELEDKIAEAQRLRSKFKDIEPEELAWTERGEMFVRFSDGHEATYSPELLRAICPCAECRGTHGGPPKAFNIISPAKMQGATKQTVIEGVEPAGNYALIFIWGDGHREGIYSWTYLRALSPQGVD